VGRISREDERRKGAVEKVNPGKKYEEIVVGKIVNLGKKKNKTKRV